jgi:DNA primase
MFRRDLWEPDYKKTGDGYSRRQVGSVVAALGLDVRSETFSDYLILCPFHNNRNTPACEVQKNKGLFFCFSCGERGTLIDLVMRVNGCNLFEAMRFVDAYKTDDDSEADPFETDEPSTVELSLIAGLNNTALASTEAMEYFDYRGITEESVKDFMLGYSPKMGMVTIPVRNEDGSFSGFVGRKASKTEKAFKNSTGFKRKFCLFNLDNCLDSSYVFVFDATFDAIRAHQLGFPAVATMGGVTTEQALMLGRYFGTIYVVADNENGRPDSASENNFSKTKSVARKSVHMVELPSSYKDIGNMPDEEIIELLTNTISEWR